MFSNISTTRWKISFINILIDVSGVRATVYRPFIAHTLF